MSTDNTAATIRHHPSEAMLLAYAVGVLGRAHDLVVAAHLSLCAECRARVEANLAVGGRLLDALPPTPLASGALERLMRRLDMPEADGTAGAEAARPPAPQAAEWPAVLNEMLRTARSRWLGPGVRQAVLMRGSESALRLLRVRPGCALPRHGHRGAELTLVLEGAFADEGGRYGPGDLSEAGESVEHRPVAEGPGDCVCLVATSGRLRFGGLLGGLIGRAVR